VTRITARHPKSYANLWFLSELFLEWEIFQTRAVEKIEGRIFCTTNIFPKSGTFIEIMWKKTRIHYIVSTVKKTVTRKRHYVKLYIDWLICSVFASRRYEIVIMHKSDVTFNLSQIWCGHRKVYNEKRMYYRTDIVFITKLESNDNQEISYSATLFLYQ
jgi:hypothetical protein